MRHAVQAADLRLRVHLRRARRILHRLAREHAADLPVRAAATCSLYGASASTTGRSQLGRQLEPLSEPNQGLSARLPSGAKSGTRRVGAHHRGQRGRNVRDVGHHRALAPRTPACSGVKMRVDAELLHEPAFLGQRVVRAAGHRAGMADGARQLALPAADHAGDHRLREVRRRARSSRPARSRAPPPCCARRWRARRRTRAPRSGCRRPCRSRSTVRRAPARHAQVLRDGGGEAARVGEDRDRALPQRIARACRRPARRRCAPGSTSRPRRGRWRRRCRCRSAAPIARISRASCTAIFSVMMKIFAGPD